MKAYVYTARKQEEKCWNGTFHWNPEVQVGRVGRGLAAQPHGARCPEVQTEPFLIPRAEPELELSS